MIPFASYKYTVMDIGTVIVYSIGTPSVSVIKLIYTFWYFF